MLLKIILGLAISGNCVIDLDYTGECVHKVCTKTYNTYWFYNTDYNLLLEFPFSRVVYIKRENNTIQALVDDSSIYGKEIYTFYQYDLNTRERTTEFVFPENER